MRDYSCGTSNDKTKKGQTAKVYGSVLQLEKEGEHIAVACPFCMRVHLHQPTRHPISTAIPNNDDHSNDSSEEMEEMEEMEDSLNILNHVTWETDRVASCRLGTYHIVGHE